jgi:AcrR family transcriptional regulator
MGIRQRRERERREVRQAIFTAARDIALKEGWPSVTIRKIADRIEYSPPTIYEHFESKEAILVALLRQGFALLLEELRTAYDSALDPESGLLKLADAYWDFAWQHPELYQVMTGLGGVPFCAEGEPEEARAVYIFAVEVLQKVVTSLNVDVGDLRAVFEMIWGTAHGLISLAMTEGLLENPPHGKQLLQRAIHDFLAGWKAQRPA